VNGRNPEVIVRSAAYTISCRVTQKWCNSSKEG
jgi:hypothetical protein